VAANTKLPFGSRNRSNDQTNSGLRGNQVCFTGECLCCYDGVSITREVATRLAEDHGLIVCESVTKKLDILVVADPLSQSGKAQKARKYGIRIIQENVFWESLGVEVE
jgi:DNA polymerase-3 subunit epsilon